MRAPPRPAAAIVRAALAGLLTAAFAAGAAAQTPNPQALKDRLTGDAKGSAAANPQCRLFTPAEIGKWLGATVGAGENAGGGSGCSWVDKDYEVQAIVNVIGARHYVEMSGAKGFKRLTGIGRKAWVAADAGWTAGALLEDDAAIIVNLDSKKATEATVVAFLQEAIQRRQKR